ncbi:major facilitator superfamily domain-containing protein [Sordaria brevicollis]|uniref:Major facilitator superfamily domain-containing protein n=1 Tax=Sordaria brevicollis TaxID=83679 RepID=A0AAE0UBM6_SORBR|nr:major facilitator superfamily domain-containing protein [Sordaria brevicollis]
MASHNGFPDSESATTGGTRGVMDSQGMGSATARLRDTLKTNRVTDNVTEATGLLAPDDGYDVPRKDSWAAMKDFEGLPWWKKPAVWWLVAPYAMFTLAFGGSLVPKINLIVTLVCDRYFADKSAADPSLVFAPVIHGGNNPQCNIPDVQRLVAGFTLCMSVVVGILSAFTAPELGALSDRYGRTRMVAICSLGGIISEITVILAGKYPDTIHYSWILLGAFFDGLAGSFTAGSVLIHSYASDCTPPSKRGVSIGYLHACLFSGLAFGPLLAGYFVKWTGSLLSIFYVTLGCHIVFVFFIYFITPESLSKRRQLLAREKWARDQEDLGEVPRWAAAVHKLTPFGKHLGPLRKANPFAPLKILFPSGPQHKLLRRNLITLALIDMSIMGAAMSSGTILILYTKFVFNWGNLEASQFMSLVSMVRIFVLILIFPVINYIFRTRPAARRRRESGDMPVDEKNVGADELDIWVLRSALISDVIGIGGYIFARTQEWFILSAVIAAFGGLGSASIQASMSKHVPTERVGQLLGAVGLLHALARVFFPIVFNGLYAATVSTFPQAFFVLLCSIFALALVAAFTVRPHVFMAEDEDQRPLSAGSGSTRNRERRDLLEDEEVIPNSL